MSAMNFDDVFARLAGIVGDALRVDVARITPETNLIVDLNAESIDLVDIRFRVEEAFGFRVDQRAFVAALADAAVPNDAHTLATMQRLVEFVIRQQAGDGA